MASVSFYLKDRSSKKTRIICQLVDSREYRIKISTGISVNPRHWSKKGYVLSADSNSIAHNNFLKEFENRVYTIYEDCLVNGLRPDLAYFKEKLKPDKPIETSSFWEAYDKYLFSKQLKVQKESYKKLKSIRNHLIAFENSRGEGGINFDNVDSVFLDDLSIFLNSERQLNNATVGKHIKFIKGFFNWSVERGYLNNESYKRFKVHAAPEKVKVILSEEDLRKIKSLNLKNKGYLINARELLVLSTLTGLRFSDYSTIKKEHYKIDENGPELFIRQEKTEEFVSIPLTSESERIVQDIVEEKIRTISNQKMNKYAKELCKLAGLTDTFEVHNYIGNEKSTEIKEKWELVTTHTGRRTFATNLLIKGVPAETVMEFTGHKTYSSFSKYVNIPKVAKMNMVRKALLD